MTVIGQLGTVVRLKGSLSGGSAGTVIPVAGFNITNTVGAIPTCSIIIPIEFVGKIKTQDKKGEDIPYTVSIGYGGAKAYPIFTGFFCGDGHEITGHNCGAQMALIHPASKIDQGQVIAQGLHSSSTLDFSNIVKNKGNTSGGGSVCFIPFFVGGNIVTGLVQGIQTAMAQGVANTTDASGSQAASQDAQSALKAVGSIKAPNGGTLDSSISGPLTVTINEYMQKVASNSLSGRTSAWDLLSQVFSAFNLLLVCNCSNGSVIGIPDVTGMRPPGDNLISGRKEITAARASSSITRNIGQVTLFSAAMVNPATHEPGPQVSFASYPTKKAGGSELGLTVPGWLNPLAQPIPSAQLLAIQQKLAQSYYYIEKNKMKSASISTALAPLANPGTMVVVDPYSAMKPLSHQDAKAVTQRYAGYLYQVSHVYEPASQQIYSIFSLRNYVPMNEADLVGGHPLFPDASCPKLL